jgi:hypothetical protein
MYNFFLSRLTSVPDPYCVNGDVFLYYCNWLMGLDAEGLWK